MRLTLKQRWRALSQGRAGHRFQERYAAARKFRTDASWGQRVRRTLLLVVALASIVIAVFLMFLPGPAIVFYFLAGTLLARESRYVARLMDWGEVRLRALWGWGTRRWARLPGWGRAMLVLLFVGLSTTSTYISYRLLAR